MYSIGIDLGGTNIAGAVLDSQGNIVFKKSIPTRRERHWEAIVNDIGILVKSLVKDYGIRMGAVQSVGVGCPGIIDPHSGRVVFASNLAFEDVPIQAYLQEMLPCPIHIENDANAAAYGEYVAGIGKDYKSFVAITIGTGIGSGIIMDNKIFFRNLSRRGRAWSYSDSSRRTPLPMWTPWVLGCVFIGNGIDV